jgi:hypothetical protein
MPAPSVGVRRGSSLRPSGRRMQGSVRWGTASKSKRAIGALSGFCLQPVSSRTAEDQTSLYEIELRAGRPPATRGTISPQQSSSSIGRKM